MKKYTLPKVEKRESTVDPNSPVSSYSYSSLCLFTTSPLMFKMRYVNNQNMPTTSSISSVIGRAFHHAMNTFCTIEDEAKAYLQGLEAGVYFLSEYNDGFIEFSTQIETKQKALEVFTFVYSSYHQEKTIDRKSILGSELYLEHQIDVNFDKKRLNLPIGLKGYVDLVTQEAEGIVITDYKVTAAFSDEEKIDGNKIIQAVQYYFLAYAEFGKPPYAMRFQEIKRSKNRDLSPQVKQYDFIYQDNRLLFDLYFRLYGDVTKALSGEMVYVPNFNALFDNEVAMIAYIHRLDEPEELAAQMKLERVENITELLRNKINAAANMKEFAKLASKKFISGESLNYESMNTEERIQAKFMEHGMLIKYASTITGHSVELLQYEPAIGVKMSTVKSYAADVEQVTGKTGVRVLAPVPGTSYIGFEVPKSVRTYPETPEPTKSFELNIGVDVYGNNKTFDLRNATLMLVAGASGSGKSVFLSSLIEQLVQVPNAELYLFDPKIVELAPYKSFATVYASTQEDIYLRLMYLSDEMDRRYELFASRGVRNIAEYGDMKYKVVIIDEFGDLVLGKDGYSKAISELILKLGQKARAAGIHLVIATQRPSVDIISGSIKANFPTKVAFRMAKRQDSLVLLDQTGAELLLGKGDMIFSTDEGEYRLQGYSI